MRVAEVAKLTPLERLEYWIRERHNIFLKRRAGRPKPWTDDEFLQGYRFCNPIRMNDKVSRWLLDEWYTPFRDHPNMLVAVTLARHLNNIETLTAIGFPEDWCPNKLQAKLEQRAKEGLKNYSAAYMITARYGRNRAPETKPYQTVWRVCNPVYESRLEIERFSMERTWANLQQFDGFSSFIAGQVVADLRWALTGDWQDRNSWAPMGPGSKRGVNRLLGRPPEQRLDQGEFLKHLLATWGRLKKRLPPMEAMDFQSCFCEFDKYERLLWGEGRPKQRFQGV